MAAKRNRSPKPAAAPALAPVGDELVSPDALTQFFAELGDDDGVSVSIYEVDPKDRAKRSFLFKLASVETLRGPELMSQVLEKYGPGRYAAEGRDDANGQIAYFGVFQVGPMREPRAEIPGPVRAEAPASSSSTSSSSSALEQVLANQTRMLEALLQRATQPVDPFATIKQLAAVRDLFMPSAAPAAAPALDLAGVVAAVKSVLDLRDSLTDAGGGGGDSPMLALARTLGPALSKLLEAAANQAPPALPAPPSRSLAFNGKPQPVTPPPAPRAQPLEVDPMRDTMLRVYVGELVGLAEQGAPPAAAVERIKNTLLGFPASVQEAVLEWLNDENVVGNLGELDARATKHAEWLVAVVDGLLDAFGFVDTDAGDSSAPAATDNAPTPH